MIARTKFAITGEDTRYFLNGALFFKDASEMTMVGTDGHRLALVSMKSIKSGKSPKNPDVARVIFPKKTLQELSSLLTDNDKEISYQEEENHLFFNVGGRTLISRKVDAQFPAYERVIPKDSDKAVEFERDRLNQAIKRVALLSNERSSAVTFKIGNDVVDITSSRQDVGEASEKIEVEYGGDSVQICLNAKYVLDFLNVVETDNVRLEFRNETSQAVMQPVGAEGYQYTYVIMPMRI
jgi:DNA polymerase-3 subunit beta